MTDIEAKREAARNVRRRADQQVDRTIGVAPNPRAAIYLRVSTGRQAEHDLSIPDQKAQTEAWLAQRGWSIIAEYVEPGASATDDKRPEFQRMIERACDGEHAFDVIIVHSFSRFFRDAFGLEFYVRKLAKHGVKLVSITQELGDDPAQLMMRQVIALFDEYQSKENAKHVLRAMKENVRQGYWNGSLPPYGYVTVEAERRGARVKKKLAIDPVEAELVRTMFKLFLEGINGSGPLGVKKIVEWLNTHGYRTRLGSRWGVGRVHAMLSNPVYGGRLRFNRIESRTRRLKSAGEYVYCDVPGIIDPAVFERTQTLLWRRNPRVTPPRAISAPVLLTGLAVCAHCGGSMTMRTGTSRSGQIYRYYSCASFLSKGRTACKGRSIRMDKLDTVVTQQVLERLLEPERLADILSALAGRNAAKAADFGQRIGALQEQVSTAEDRLRRLYRLVEDGRAEADDLLRERIAAIRSERDAAKAALDRAVSGKVPASAMDPAMLVRFGQVMRERLTTGEITFRRTQLASFLERIEIDEHAIRIVGRKDILEQAVIAGGALSPGVRSFVRGWRPRQDSNLRPSA
jgi:site-specific DNA recombinase